MILIFKLDLDNIKLC